MNDFLVQFAIKSVGFSSILEGREINISIGEERRKGHTMKEFSTKVCNGYNSVANWALRSIKIFVKYFNGKFLLHFGANKLIRKFSRLMNQMLLLCTNPKIYNISVYRFHKTDNRSMIQNRLTGVFSGEQLTHRVNFSKYNNKNPILPTNELEKQP